MFRILTLALICPSAFGTSVGGSDAVSAVPPAAAFEIGALDRVVTDVGVDGSIWALGSDWKMRIGIDGATFFPKLGTRAEQHRALEFGEPQLSIGGRILENAPPKIDLDGVRARIDRGGCTEIYDFAPNFVEQSFAIDSLPARGEIRLRIPISTELPTRVRDQGLEFEIQGQGTVRYGGATIVDAAGRRLESASRWRDTAIEIEVPEAFVRTATLPIVIDPIVSSVFDIVTTGTIQSIDLSFDATQNVWFVVYSEGAVGSDRDILARRISSSGSVLDVIPIDITTDDTTDPSVANNAVSDQFLVVWRKAKNGLFDQVEIQGRTRKADGTAQSAKFVISAGSDDESEPSVGGRTSGGNYLVAWSENPALGIDGRNIACATVSTAGVVGSVKPLSSTSGDEIQPAVSKGFAGAWMVTWTRVTGGQTDVRAAMVGGTGAIAAADTVLDAGSLDDGFAESVASSGSDFIVKWERQFGSTTSSDADIEIARYVLESGKIVRESSLADFSKIEDAQETLKAFRSRIALDGKRVLLPRAEQTPVLNKLSSLDFSGDLPIPLEKSLSIFAGSSLLDCEIGSQSECGGAAGRSLIVALVTSVGSSSPPVLRGQFFDPLDVGGVSIVPTSCGGAAAPKIFVSNQAALCQDLQITSIGFQQGLLFVGIPATIPLCPVQSGCALGVVPLVILPFGNTSLPVTLPCDPALFNAKVGFTGVSVVAAPVAGACGPPKFSASVLTSDTILIDFQ